MASRVARELERHFQSSRFQADPVLVFPNPATGRPFAAPNLVPAVRGSSADAEHPKRPSFLMGHPGIERGSYGDL